MGASYRKPVAVVLTDDGVHYDTGRHHPLSEQVDLDQLADVLAGADRALRGGEGVILIDRTVSAMSMDRMTGPDAWTYRGVRPWTTFTRGRSAIHVGFIPDLLATPAKLGPLLHGAEHPAEMAYRLGRYHHLTGAAWRLTAGVTGCAGLRLPYRDRGPREQPLWHYAGPKGLRGAGPLVWTSPDQPDPDAPGRVLAFDVNAMYLASLSKAPVAWGRLSPYTGPFDPDMPGWWEIDIAELDPGLYDGAKTPPVFPHSHIHRGAVWLSTQVVKYLAIDLGYSPVVLTALVSDNPFQVGRSYGERLQEVRADLLHRDAEPGERARLLLGIKRTYAELVGMAARDSGSIYRPDWAVAWMDLARMNFFRRLSKATAAGFLPIMVRTDCAYFYSTDPQDVARLSALLGVGSGAGTFKHDKTLTVAEYLAERRGGRG